MEELFIYFKMKGKRVQGLVQ